MQNDYVHISQTGGCQCGAVRYLLDGPAYQLNVCHCRDCQRQSGSAFGMSLVIPTDTFGLTAGSLKTFVTQVNAGRSKTCAFCADCGVRCYNATARMMSVKPGTLDDTSWLQPDGHYWLKRKQPWTLLAAHTPHYLMAD